MPPSHSDELPEYCDVALPIPLDRTYTYALPLTLRHRVRPGARVAAPFGARKLTGVVVACHDDAPRQKAREVLRLFDEEPVLDAALFELAEWIRRYYSAPIGEVLRAMLPLGGEIRERKLVKLTGNGAEVAARFASAVAADDPMIRVLQALEKRPLGEAYLKRKFPGAANAIKTLIKKGLLSIETDIEGRDPLLARDGRLLVTAGDASKAPAKPKIGERWLLDYVAAHPGEHDLAVLALERKDAAAVAKRLDKAGALRLRLVRERPIGERAPEELKLSQAQRAALQAIEESLRAKAYKTFLLEGVTGSGKTEVYLRAIDEALASGGGALLLVPEIGLTPAVAARFFGRFGDRAAILHSAFTGAQRSEQWRRIQSGEAQVVVGTRSAVFAPIRNLRLVIVDEEHESSYKQDDTPRYHGRDVAVVRAQKVGATVVLGSATPGLESRRNAETGKYELLTMPERIEKRPMPQVEIVDLREEFAETRKQALFSRPLAEAINQRLDAGEQSMILLNRRGFSMYAMCRACGCRIECQNCSVTLTFHRKEQRLRCHYCDYAEPKPEKCPQCESEYMQFFGSGSEKVEDALREQFPKARIARLDRDTVRGRDHYEQILGAFRDRRYDILIGTQMIAKGHDIPNVTLVGVVSADVGLGVPDFRAAERSFQLLTQVAGRAGRGNQPGYVYFQTMNPDHYAITFAAKQDYEGFYRKEAHFRRMMHYPPFAAMASLIVRSIKLDEALAMSGRLGRYLHPTPAEVRMLGPAAAPVVKLKTEFRYQFVFKSSSRKKLAEVVRSARGFAQSENWPATALVVDVDPMSLM